MKNSQILNDILAKIDSVEMSMKKINIIIDDMKITIKPNKTLVELSKPIIETK